MAVAADIHFNNSVRFFAALTLTHNKIMHVTTLRESPVRCQLRSDQTT